MWRVLYWRTSIRVVRTLDWILHISNLSFRGELKQNNYVNNTLLTSLPFKSWNCNYFWLLFRACLRLASTLRIFFRGPLKLSQNVYFFLMQNVDWHLFINLHTYLTLNKVINLSSNSKNNASSSNCGCFHNHPGRSSKAPCSSSWTSRWQKTRTSNPAISKSSRCRQRWIVVSCRCSLVSILVVNLPDIRLRLSNFLGCRFEKDDVFIVHNDMEGDWMWVTSQRTNESGCVFKGAFKNLIKIFPRLHTHLFQVLYEKWSVTPTPTKERSGSMLI